MSNNLSKTRLKAAPILLLGMLLCAMPSYAQDDEGKLHELYDENSEAAMPILEEKIRSGTPAEKEEALWLFRDQKIINLIPSVIDAVGDPTSLPRHGDTGWGFVAHQAASGLGWLAQSLDGVSLKNRGRDKYSFHDDMYKGGQTLKNSGRLSEVKANWRKWWQNYRLKSNKANSADAKSRAAD